MNKDNIYTKMQKDFYNSTADMMAVENHKTHDNNPDYYNLLLKEIKNQSPSWDGKIALDFGCGVGRNIDNLYKLANWNRVDGCDISEENLIRADKFLQSCDFATKLPYTLQVTDGTTLQPLKDETYDFVMSTIVLQHIAVYDIRKSLLNDIYRVMKSGALFSFQMAKYNHALINSANYFDNIWTASGTNGEFDVSVDDPKDLINDLINIGFQNISFEIKPDWDWINNCYLPTNRSEWIYVKAFK